MLKKRTRRKNSDARAFAALRGKVISALNNVVRFDKLAIPRRKHVEGVGGVNANLSPDAFYMYASHYLKAYSDFKPPIRFSPVPYFLLCRCLELAFKSRHLVTESQKDVKENYGHDLVRVYEALDAQDQILTVNQLSTLGTANKIYSDKGFEYFDPENALTGYKHYPSLIELKRIADSVLAAYKKKRLLARPLSP